MMGSAIDPTTPADGAPASKRDLRENLRAAKREIEHGGFYEQVGIGAVERTVRARLIDGYLSIRDFGALGDGTGATVAEWLAGGARDRGYADLDALREDYPELTTLDATIDAAAILRAINQALAERRDVLIPNGTFVVDPETQPLAITLAGGGRLTIAGLGRNSVLKRKEGSTKKDFRRLLVATTGIGGFDYLEFRDFTLDSNARGNPIPDGESSWVFEHSADIYVQASGESRLDCVRFANLYCLDAVADHLNVGNAEGEGTTVRRAIFESIVARRRTRPRADIIIYSGCDVAFLNNIDVQRLETEFNSAPRRDIWIYANNVVTDTLDVASDGDEPRHLRLVAQSVCVREATLLAQLSATFDGARLRLNDRGRLIDVGDVLFADCEILLPYDAETGEAVPLSLQHDEDSTSRASFVRCSFVVDAGPDVTRIGGYAVAPFGAVPASQPVPPEMEFERCRFDRRLQGCIQAYRGGVWSSSGCRFACREHAVMVGISDDKLQHYISIDDDFSEVGGEPFVLGSGQSGTANCKLNLQHDCLPSSRTGFATASSAWTGIDLTSTRLILIDQGPPQGGGVVGDRVRLRAPAPGQALEWVCVESDPAVAAWKVSVTLEA